MIKGNISDTKQEVKKKMGGVANRHVVYWSFLPSDKNIVSWREIVFNVQFKGRDSGNRTKLFEANYIPFELKFRLPKLRKSRIIFKRDEFGRIIHSHLPRPV